MHIQMLSRCTRYWWKITYISTSTCIEPPRRLWWLYGYFVSIFGFRNTVL